MGISSYYEIVPEPLLARLTGNKQLLSVFECMWGCGSGMYFWFEEMEEEDELVSPKEAAALATHLQRLSVDEVVGQFELGERVPVEAWRESLSGELKELIDCYCLAGKRGHHVLVGMA